MTKEIMWRSVLENYLIKAYKIEAVGEYLYYNQSLLDQETIEYVDFYDKIITLMKDSKDHKEKLEKSFEGLNLPLTNYISDMGSELYKEYFKNTKVVANEIFLNLVINENQMIDLYERIGRRTNSDLIKEISDKTNEEFMDLIEELKQSEKEHQGIIKDLMSNNDFLDRVNCSVVKEVSEVLEELKNTYKKLNSNIKYGYRDVLFYRGNKSLFNELMKKLEDYDEFNIRSRVEKEEKIIFEIEIFSI